MRGGGALRPALAPLTAPALGEAVRRPWGVENRVHLVLDVGFGEGQGRIRAGPPRGYPAETVAVLRHPQRVPGAELRPAVALTLLHQQQTKGVSLTGKRKKAGWDTDYLLQVLRGIQMR